MCSKQYKFTIVQWKFMYEYGIAMQCHYTQNEHNLVLKSIHTSYIHSKCLHSSNHAPKGFKYFL